MEYVSIPRGALAARWRPVSPAVMQPWRPGPVQMAGPAPASAPKLGATSIMTAGDLTLDSLMSLGAITAGFGMALFGPKDAPSWRWVGGLTGAVGVMRLLHNIGNIGQLV